MVNTPGDAESMVNVLGIRYISVNTSSAFFLFKANVFCGMSEQSNIVALSNAEIIMELGKCFKEYRLSCRLTQQEAADKAGITVVTLRQFENGKTLLGRTQS